MDIEQIPRDPEYIRRQKIWDMTFEVRRISWGCLWVLFIGLIFVLIEKYEYKDHNASLWCNPDVVVSLSGGEKFSTISDAVEAAPNFSSFIYCIHIRKGQYTEKVFIPYQKTNIASVGDGENETTIIANGNCGRKHCQLQVATFRVKGPGFIAADISIVNYDNVSNISCVAVENWSDRSIFYRCSLVSRYSVLNSKKQYQFYRECHIQGSGSLIYGDGVAFFQNCSVIVDRSLRQERNVLALRSLNTSAFENRLVLHLCIISATGGGGTTFGFYPLGAPLGVYARILYLECEIDLKPGWLASLTTYFAEYNNVGPGGSRFNRSNSTYVHILNKTSASHFSPRRFFVHDWVPEIVPHQLDLL